MARAHEIAIAADAREFDEGIRSGVIKPLEKAEQALEDLADAADDAGRDGSRGIDRLEDALKDAQRQSKKTEDAVDDIGTGGKRSFGKLSEGAQEVTQEVGQNLGEAVSSIRGDLSDLGQVGQDTLGGLAATLASTGPSGIAGAAALAGGAVGLGLITAELQKQQQEAEKLRDRMVSAYSSAVEEGRVYLDTAQIIANANDLMFNPERAEEWKKVQETQNQTALDMSTLLKANAGDLDAQAVVLDTLNRLFDKQGGLINENGQYTQEFSDIMNGTLPSLIKGWEDLNGVTQQTADTSATAATSVSDLLLDLIANAGTATEEVDDLNNRLITLQTENGEQKIVIDAETGQAHQNLDRFKGDADGIIDEINGKEVVITARADTRQFRIDLEAATRSRTVRINPVWNNALNQEWD